MRGLFRSLLVSLWFMFLTFPILVIRITPEGAIIWRLENALLLGVGVFLLSFVWRALLAMKGITGPEESDLAWLFNFMKNPRNKDRAIGIAVIALGLLPLAFALAGFLGAPDKNESSAMPLALSAAFALPCLYFGLSCLAHRRGRVLGHVGKIGEKLTNPGLPRVIALICLLLFMLPLPWFMDMYRVNIMATTFIWIMLGLGLNIVVGQAGLLVLGYAAFYAVGAYAYAVCNSYFGSDIIGFWLLLPIGGLLAAVAGILLSLPVLRLKGDYLAIVTLGFGEIVRVTLEGGGISLAPLASLVSLFTDAPLPAWLTTPINLGGPAGIGDIPYPTLFGTRLDMDGSIRLIYYIALSMAVLTVIAVSRLRDSRIGRAWAALREDEIACEAMGIDKSLTKLSAFALGACWAGFGGVLFAAKTTFINPSSFTFMESVLILSVIVLGGLGSTLGVALGACVLILLPEYLRSFDEYRMLIFGASMVLMMVFRPQGLIAPKPKKRIIRGVNDGGPKTDAPKTAPLPDSGYYAGEQR